MTLEELKVRLESDLNKGFITSKLLMRDFLLLNEGSRRTGAFMDPRYIPFYYHLGKYISPRNLVEVGVGLGLLSGALFAGCKTIKEYLGLQLPSEEFYNPKYAITNLRQNYSGPAHLFQGPITTNQFVGAFNAHPWDLALVVEERDYDTHRYILDTLWEGMSLNGLVVADYVTFHEPAQRAFADFCKTKNRTPIYLPTRYGVGIVQK